MTRAGPCAAPTLRAVSTELRRRLDIHVRVDDPLWPGFEFGATAILDSGVPSASGPIHGFGTAATPQEATDLAIAEAAERWAQFGSLDRDAVIGSYRDLAGSAVYPPSFGLHSAEQYDRLAPRVAPFRPDVAREWVEATRLTDDSRWLVPLELVYPGAPLPHPRLTVETSNGTALRLTPADAALTAVCELVERDALLLLWHRRAPARVIPARSLPADLSTAVAEYRSRGHVITVLRIDQDIPLPTYLVFASRGRSVMSGSATSPDANEAVRHAFRELAADLRRSAVLPSHRHVQLATVRTADDHRALYDKGPLNSVLHAALDDVVSQRAPETTQRTQLPNELEDVVAVLAERGYSPYCCDLTPPEILAAGGHVARVLVPGLIPLTFGTHGLRLACSRLTGSDAPGQLTTLLPHFFG